MATEDAVRLARAVRPALALLAVVCSGTAQAAAADVDIASTKPKADGFGWHTWTIVASKPGSGSAWDVVRVKFLTTALEEVSPSTLGCHIEQSGYPKEHAGYEPENAFKDDESWWDGRPEGTPAKFYIGVTCNKNHNIVAVQLKQASNEHTVSELQVYHNQWLVSSKRVTAGWLQTVWAGTLGVRLEVAELYSGRSLLRMWEVQRIKFMAHPDHKLGFDGGELRPGRSFGCEVVDSNPSDERGADNAFDNNDDFWIGKKGPFGKFFIGLECTRPFPWPLAQVYLQQRDENYATWVKLQVKTAFGWKTKDTMDAGPSKLLPLL